MKNGSNQEQEIQPMMILTIDIGNGHVDKLQLFDLNNIEQETYDFCVKNKLDFNTMQEINTQIQNVLKDKQLEEEQEIETVFQEIKEEDDEKITENNVNEVREQESIIITNSNEMDTQKENNNINNNNNNDIIPENIIEEKNNIMIDDKNRFEKENDNINDLNINNKIKKNNNNINNNHNQSIRTNNSNSSYGNDNKQNRKYNKSKKKNIKNNIKEAIAMAKEKTKQNNQKLIDKENNKIIYENIDNNEIENINNNFEENNNIEDNNNFEENKNIEDNKNSNINKIYQKKEMKGKEENKNNENYENKENNENNLTEFNINNVNNENNDNNKNEDKEENKNENFENINKNLRENINNEIDDNQNIEVKEADKKEVENNLNKNEIRNEENEKNKENILNNNNINNQNNSKETIQTNKKRNKSLSNNGSHISSYNPGKELYERGLKFKENEKEKLEALKKNLEVDEAEDNTFIPKINKLSEIQRERIKEKGLECTNPNIIRNYMEYKKEKIEILKKKTDEEFKKIYTFKPCINRSYSSTKIIKNQMGLENNMKGKNDSNNNNKMKNESRFDKLYNYRIDYKENKNRLEEKIYNEYSFKPQINENSCFYKLNIPFNERLQTYSNKSKENMIKIQQVYEKELGYDESFKPHLNKQKNKSLLKDRDEFFLNEIQKHNNIQDINNNNGNNNCNNNGNNNYIDHYTKLFLYGKKYQQEKNELTEKYYQNQNKSPQFCESTEEIINRKKEKSFRQIFKLLDGDEDSKISSTHMNISKLPKNISKILEPIFNELKEENETLNELEFIFVCEQLYLSLPWNDKRELTTFEDIAKKNIKKEKLLKEKNNYSFKPKINKRNFSFERPTKLYNDKSNKVLYQREINKNNEYNNYNNNNDIFNKSQNNYISNYKKKNNCNSNSNSNSYYIKKNKTNSYQRNQENKNNSNKINNRVNYFNLKISNQNSDINKKSQKEHNYINNNNNNKDKFTILKNANINIIGNSNIKNENKTEPKNSKVLGKRINYDNFVNVKVCS